MSLELNPLIIKIIEAGYQLSPEAYKFLQKLPRDTTKKMITSAIEEAEKNPDHLVLHQAFIMAAYNLKHTKSSRKESRTQEILSNKIAFDGYNNFKLKSYKQFNDSPNSIEKLKHPLLHFANLSDSLVTNSENLIEIYYCTQELR